MQSYAKNDSPVEALRKPLSFAAAAVLIAASIFTVPQHSGSATYEIMEVAGFVLLIFAALGRVWASIYIAGRKNRELCTLGPYSICRNPLYFFSFLGVLGFALAIQNILVGLLALGVFLTYYHGVILSEERRLGVLFKESFTRYIEEVPRFWPALRMPQSCAEITVNPRILERGLREVVWFLLAIIGAEALESLHGMDAFWHITLPL